MVEEGKNWKKEVLWYLLLLVGFVLLVLYWEVYIDVQELSAKIEPILPKVALTIITFFFVNVLIRVSVPILKRAIYHRIKPEEWKVVHSLYVYFIWLIAILIIISGVFGNLSSLGISLSVIGAGVAFALQQVILSFAGWFLIMIKRPYKIGDRIYIKSKDILGDVDDISMLFTVLKEVTANESVTGKNVIVPNSTVFLEPIENYSYDTPHVWTSLVVSVTYESDLGLAEKIIFDQAKEVAGNEMQRAVRIIRRRTPDSVQLEFAREDPAMRVEFGASSVDVRVRFMSLPKQVPFFKSEIYRKVLQEFNKPENKDKVEVAYPHMEMVLHDEVMSDRVKRYLEK